MKIKSFLDIENQLLSSQDNFGMNFINLKFKRSLSNSRLNILHINSMRKLNLEFRMKYSINITS